MKTLSTKRNEWPPSEEQIRHWLNPFSTAVTAVTCRQVKLYAEKLVLWNKKVNLTSIREPKELIERHFGEAFFGASAISVRSGLLVDVGSGAGFPGLAIKLILPEMQVKLLEPNAKKAAFLHEVVRSLEVERVQILRARMEDVRPAELSADYVTSRGLGARVELAEWARMALRPGGELLLWLGRQDAEKISKTPGWKWKSSRLIPGSQRRVLLVGSAN